MTAKARSALVIGGGISGPVMALALQKAGIESTIYEAYEQAPQGPGGGMSIAPNGLAALDVLALGDQVRAAGVPMTGIVLQDWAGRRLGEFGNARGVAPMRFIMRADLQRVLLQEARRCGIRIERGKRLTRIDEGSAGICARFADGTEASADIVIGADGIRSTVRALIDPQAPAPQYAGLISFGARLQDSGFPSTDGKMNMSFGKRGFFGYQIFDDGSVSWFVNLPRRSTMTASEAKRTAAADWIALLSEAFAEDRTPARDFISRTKPAELVIVGPVENMPKVPKWSRGRMVLIGDAAHAPSSSSGQGASLAIESAIELAQCLRDLPVERALVAYEALRRPRVERVIAETTRTNSSKTAGPVGRVINGLLMRVVTKLVRPEKLAWMFQYPIDWGRRVEG
jgi:2-polyprenyl-6-methoxyphenol hydroxylase-like FAD-dependent oxidoreductase